MANASISTLATQFAANAAAVATAAGGTIVTSDITALAQVLANLANDQSFSIPLIAGCVTSATASTMLTPA